MKSGIKRAAIGGLVLGAAVGGVAFSTGSVFGSDDLDESEVPITGEALERASAAALAHTGGGEVTETEVGDEESYYEVEVTLEDGRAVDVQLDESFNVVSSELDRESDDAAED